MEKHRLGDVLFDRCNVYAHANTIFLVISGSRAELDGDDGTVLVH
ncbi:hypothetical protein ACFYSW_03490 [Rhodococcus aetherivorans]